MVVRRYTASGPPPIVSRAVRTASATAPSPVRELTTGRRQRHHRRRQARLAECWSRRRRQAVPKPCRGGRCRSAAAQQDRCRRPAGPVRPQVQKPNAEAPRRPGRAVAPRRGAASERFLRPRRDRHRCRPAQRRAAHPAVAPARCHPSDWALQSESTGPAVCTANLSCQMTTTTSGYGSRSGGCRRRREVPVQDDSGGGRRRRHGPLDPASDLRTL